MLSDQARGLSLFKLELTMRLIIFAFSLLASAAFSHASDFFCRGRASSIGDRPLGRF